MKFHEAIAAGINGLWFVLETVATSVVSHNAIVATFLFDNNAGTCHTYSDIQK